MSRQFHDLEIALFTEDYFLEIFFRFYFLIVPTMSAQLVFHTMLVCMSVIRLEGKCKKLRGYRILFICNI